MNVDGLTVVENSGVAAGTLYIGDFTRSVVYNAGNIEVEAGFENDDFTKDMVTIKARKRLALLIRNVDLGAFRYIADIAVSTAAISVPAQA
jgi:hypothetical protein